MELLILPLFPLSFAFLIFIILFLTYFSESLYEDDGSRSETLDREAKTDIPRDVLEKRRRVAQSGDPCMFIPFRS
jgi:hypothetical protein